MAENQGFDAGKLESRVAKLEASVDSVWAIVRKVVKSLEKMFGIDIDRDGKIGYARIAVAFCVLIMASGWLLAVTQWSVERPETSGVMSYNMDSDGVFTIIANEATAVDIIGKADQSDDAGDDYKLSFTDGSGMVYYTDADSAGTFAQKLAVGTTGIITTKGGGTIDNTTSATVMNLTETTVRVTGAFDTTGGATINGDVAYTFDAAGEEFLITATNGGETAGYMLRMLDNTAGGTAGKTLLRLDYTADGDAQGEYLECRDNASGDTKFKIDYDGITTIAGAVDAPNFTCDAAAGLDTQAAGALNLGAATATSVTLGATDCDTTINNDLIINGTDIKTEAGDALTVATTADSTTGAGNDLTVTASAANTTGAGGKVDINAGAGAGVGAGGAVEITAGDDGTSGGGGAVDIDAGAATSGTGGGVDVTAGLSASGAGGAVTVLAGAGGGTGAGGAVSVTAGASGAGATGNGGAVSLTSGTALSVNGAGGELTLLSGDGTGTGNAGTVGIASGTGGAGTQGDGGPINIEAGAGGADGDGGSIAITGGNSGGGDEDGGDITLTAGDKNGSGVDGEIVVKTGGNVTIKSGGNVQIADEAGTGNATLFNIDATATEVAGTLAVTGETTVDGKYAVVGPDATTGQMVLKAAVTALAQATQTNTFATVFGAAPIVVCTYTEDPGDVRPLFVTSVTPSNFVANQTSDKNYGYVAVGTRP